MRLPLRAIALATSAVTLVAAGAIAVSVNASALEPASAPRTATSLETSFHVSAIVDAELAFDLRSTYLRAAHERHIREQAIARAQAKKAAREARVHKLRARVIAVAKNQIGDRYSAGAVGPSAFDCSGFTRYVYRVAVGKNLAHYSRAQYDQVKKIPLKQARPGDLVFFLRNGAHHVGSYLGLGRMVDAAGYGKGVRISPISGSWWSRTYTGIGRLLPA